MFTGRFLFSITPCVYAQLFYHSMLLKSWAEGRKSSAYGANQFMDFLNWGRFHTPFCYLCPISTPLKSFSKVGRRALNSFWNWPPRSDYIEVGPRAQKISVGCQTDNEIDPSSTNLIGFLHFEFIESIK